MANTTHVQVIQDGPKYLIVNFTLEYVDTAISGTTVVDVSATAHTSSLAAGNAATPARHGAVDALTLEEIYWSIAGFDQVELFTDHTDDQNHIYMSAGDSYADYRPYGGIADKGSGGTGDWQITAQGTAAAGDSISLFLKFKKNYSS